MSRPHLLYGLEWEQVERSGRFVLVEVDVLSRRRQVAGAHVLDCRPVSLRAERGASVVSADLGHAQAREHRCCASAEHQGHAYDCCNAVHNRRRQREHDDRSTPCVHCDTGPRDRFRDLHPAHSPR
ncbi:hypothetical protein [Embleya sp. MST-111070]|uniref:hypothetical protein n=1 Tax=Embleya sp. MST-111070 TaxID=3398231 RepID=UPI003F737522